MAAADGLRDVTAAVRAAEELAAHHPDRVEIHRTVGELHMERGDTEASIASFRRVLALDPDDAKTRLRLSRAMSSQGEDLEALEVLLPAAETTANARTMTMLAGLYRRLERTDEAIAALRRAVQLNPTQRAAWSDLAALLGQVGRPDEAAEARASLASIVPKLSTAEVVERVDAALAGDAQSYVVNIGCRDGKGWEDPCYELYRNGYAGVAIDAGDFPDLHRNLPQPEVRKLLNTPVTPANVAQLLAGAGCPRRPSLLKIDIDSFDGVVLAAALERFEPSVIQIEVNPEIPPPLRFAIEYHPRYRHSGKAGFFGCSVAYLTGLCRPLGYELLEIDLTDPPLRQDAILVKREYLSLWDVALPVDERELFLREPVAAGGFKQIGVDSAAWRDRTDYRALLEEVRAACEAGSLARSGEILPFILRL